MKKRSATVLTDGQVLMDHIRELRTRIVVCAAVLVLGGIVGYFFYTPILEWLRSPLGTSLYYNTPAGSFNFILKVASMVGILAMVPFVIFQIIMFVQPVFKEKLSTMRVVFYTFASIILAVAGASFAFYAILPGALRFFAGFQVEGLSAIIDANNYLNFVINAIVTFIIVFQIPLLMIIIDRIKPISPKKLLSMEKYVVLGGLVVSLIVPFAMDVTTSILIASPIIILYNLSVGVIFMRHAMARRRVTNMATEPAQVVTTEEDIIDQTIADLTLFETEVIPEFSQTTDAQLSQSLELSDPVESEPISTVTPVVTAIRHRIGLPLHEKPKPGEVNVAELREQARLKREREIAERVARYNNSSFKIISDIR